LLALQSDEGHRHKGWSGGRVERCSGGSGPEPCLDSRAGGRDGLDLLPGHAGTGLSKMYAQVVDSGEPLVLDDFVYAQELRGGQERHYDIRAARVGDGLTYTWRDVTDSHLAERRLRAAYDSMLDPHVLYEAIRDENGQIADFRFVDANPDVSTTSGTARS
jgi:PAS domain-containing protein